MRNASSKLGHASKVKMRGSEIRANRNTNNKIFGEHLRQFLHKKYCVPIGSFTFKSGKLHFTCAKP